MCLLMLSCLFDHPRIWDHCENNSRPFWFSWVLSFCPSETLRKVCAHFVLSFWAIREFEIIVKTTPGQFDFHEFCLSAHTKIGEMCVLILFCPFGPSENLRSLWKQLPANSIFMSFVCLPIRKFEKCVCSFCFVCFGHQKIWDHCKNNVFSNHVLKNTFFQCTLSGYFKIFPVFFLDLLSSRELSAIFFWGVFRFFAHFCTFLRIYWISRSAKLSKHREGSMFCKKWRRTFFWIFQFLIFYSIIFVEFCFL